MEQKNTLNNRTTRITQLRHTQYHETTNTTQQPQHTEKKHKHTRLDILNTTAHRELEQNNTIPNTKP